MTSSFLRRLLIRTRRVKYRVALIGDKFRGRFLGHGRGHRAHGRGPPCELAADLANVLRTSARVVCRSRWPAATRRTTSVSACTSRGNWTAPRSGLLTHCVVGRRETLRTTFDLHEGEFVQTIHPVLRPVLDISACSEQGSLRARPMQSAREPFDLRRGPLVRVLLLRISPRRQVLVVTVHHIVADAWSLGLFIDELAENYAAFAARREPRLLPLQVQYYADYAKWQREWLKSAEAERQLASWRVVPRGRAVAAR